MYCISGKTRFAGNEFISGKTRKSDRIEFMYCISVKTRFAGNEFISGKTRSFWTYFRFFHNFASRTPILIIFTFLKMALKFIGSSSLLEECGSKNKVAYLLLSCNFASRSPILMIFMILKMALKFIEKKISDGGGIRTHELQVS